MNTRKILLIIILAGLVLPLVSFAGSYTANGREIKYEGLVPCGKATYDASKESQEVTNPCQFCHFFVMFGGIINFLIFGITLPAAVLLIVIGGAMMIFAGGNPKLVQQGNNIIKSVAIGLVIIFAAWLAVNEFLNLIGLNDWTGLQGGWFKFNCEIKL